MNRRTLLKGVGVALAKSRFWKEWAGPTRLRAPIGQVGGAAGRRNRVAPFDQPKLWARNILSRGKKKKKKMRKPKMSAKFLLE